MSKRCSTFDQIESALCSFEEYAKIAEEVCTISQCLIRIEQVNKATEYQVAFPRCRATAPSEVNGTPKTVFLLVDRAFFEPPCTKDEGQCYAIARSYNDAQAFNELLPAQNSNSQVPHRFNRSKQEPHFTPLASSADQYALWRGNRQCRCKMW